MTLVPHPADRPIPGTRPRNRKTLIINAASDLFARDGYPNVTMADVADAVAITPAALYRHFPGKEALLYEAVHQPFVLSGSVLEMPEGASLRLRTEALVNWVLDHRTLGVLWQRESRHLDPRLRAELRVELVAVARLLVDALSARRPDLSADETDLLTWAVMDALMSVSFQRVDLPRPEYAELLIDIGSRITRANLPAGDETGPGSRPVADPDETTADRLVAAAARLFAERGYHSVGVDDIAAQVGIAGPSVYHHFKGKAELLTAAIGDGARELLSEEARILAGKASPKTTLRQLVQSYVGFSFAYSHALDLMIAEAGNLDPAAGRLTLDQQRTYVREWVRLLQVIHPDLPVGHAQVRVQAALTMTNDIARTAHLSSRPGARASVCAIATAILS
jgi:AcrR family transcriptional regulator